MTIAYNFFFDYIYTQLDIAFEVENLAQYEGTIFATTGIGIFDAECLMELLFC